MLTTIIIFIGVLALLVLVHEFGHFIVAKKSGCAVEEFGIGFPPKLYGFKRGETEYTINLLPLGGFVKIKGVAGDDKNAKGYKDKDSFATKPFWVKSLILSAGVIMNLLLAWVLFGIGFSIGFPSAITPENAEQAKDIAIQVAEVNPDSPANDAGLMIGDVILDIDNAPVIEVDDIRNYNLENQDAAVTLTIKRGEEVFDQDVSLATIDGEEYLLGVTLVKTGLIRYPWYESIWLGFKQTFLMLGLIVVAFAGVIADLFTSGTVAPEIAGPVGIAVLTGQFADLGFAYLLNFTAILSINLAILNFFPFPALDGGRLLFVTIEKVRGKPVSSKVEAVIHNIGFLILIGIFLLITIRDVANIAEPIRNLFSSIK